MLVDSTLEKEEGAFLAVFAAVGSTGVKGAAADLSVARTGVELPRAEEEESSLFLREPNPPSVENDDKEDGVEFDPPYSSVEEFATLEGAVFWSERPLVAKLDGRIVGCDVDLEAAAAPVLGRDKAPECLNGRLSNDFFGAPGVLVGRVMAAKD